MPTPEETDAFVRAHTVVAAPPLVPELRLYLATEATPLWEATEKTLARIGLPPPFWAFCWPGGQALARYLLDHPEEAAGKRVLDFGAGGGIGAIAADRAGAAEVTAADLDPFAAAAIRLNAGLNGARVTPATDDLVGGDGGWDLVLAGDVCYERPAAERITSWLRLLARRGARVLLADPGRAYRPVERVEEIARYVVPTTRELEDRDTRETVLYRVLA